MSPEPETGVNRSYIVEGLNPETPSIIVFAQDGDHALLLGAGSPDLRPLHIHELHVEPLEELEMVARRAEARVLRWNNPNDLRIYRNIGWDLPGPCCQLCARFTSDLVPESRINFDGVCAECCHPVIAFPHSGVEGPRQPSATAGLK